MLLGISQKRIWGGETDPDADTGLKTRWESMIEELALITDDKIRMSWLNVYDSVKGYAKTTAGEKN